MPPTCAHKQVSRNNEISGGSGAAQIVSKIYIFLIKIYILVTKKGEGGNYGNTHIFNKSINKIHDIIITQNIYRD